MAILIKCGSCASQLRAPNRARGQSTKCPKCGTSLVVDGQRIRDHDVFISYSRIDQATAFGVCTLLEQQRLSCWIAPRNIAAGAEYADAIVDAIEGTGVMLLIFSEGANASKHVKREVERAVDKGVPLILFRTQDVSLSKGLEYFLAGSHWHQALGDQLDQHVANLLPGVRKLLRECDEQTSAETPERVELVTWAPARLAKSPTEGVNPPAPVGEVSLDPVKVPAFHFGGVVPSDFFIGRTAELQQAERSVCNGNNMLLVGELRAGKTSFGKLLIHRIMGRPNNKVLGAYLNVQQWPTLSVETFFEHTILALVGEVARQVFGVKFTALASADPHRGRPDLDGDPNFAAFLEIYRFIRSRTYTQGTAAPDPFRIEEFADVNDELMQIIRARGWTNCFVFYDEANRLGREQSVDMLLSHQEALSASGLTAIYSASPAMVDSQQVLQDWFVHQVRLGPFSSHDEMRRLLARYYFDDAQRWPEVPASADALDRLWTLSKGMPFLIQLIAGGSFDLANRLHDRELSARHVTEAHAKLLLEKPTAFTSGGD